MISFWVVVLLLIGDFACSFSKKTAKEGSCVTVQLTLSDIGNSGYIVWLKDAVWNATAKDFEGTIVHSLKPDKPNASEFENRVSVGSTKDLYKLTISNLRLEDSGKYMVRYYDKADPPHKGPKSSSEMSLEVQNAPKDVRATANPRGEVTEKTNLDLSCKARSNPGVTAYTWFKLTGRGTREVGKGPVLTLRNLSETHTGQYFCRTRNEIGEGDSNVIEVIVRCECRFLTCPLYEGLFQLCHLPIDLLRQG